MVNVDAPDLNDFAKEINDSFKKADGAIKLPKPEKTNMKPVVDELKKVSSLLKELLEYPAMNGGGGGSTGLVQAEDSSGTLRTLTAVESADSPGVYGLLVLNADGSAVSTGGGGSTPTDTDNLLLESGDNLLLETGDQLLLESA